MRNFIQTDDKETIQIIKALNHYLMNENFDPAKVKILSADCPFYPAYDYLDIELTQNAENLHLFALYQKEHNEIHVLDGSNAVIDQLNDQKQLCLNADIIPQYLKFYFQHVRGDKGRFTVIESADDFNWLSQPNLQLRKTIQKMISPLILIQSDGDKSDFRASIAYKNALFDCIIRVFHNGKISFTQQELVIEDLDLLDYVLE